MKRLRIPGLANLFHVEEPEEIRALARDPAVDRTFRRGGCPFHALLLGRSLAVLSVDGRRFPTMEPRDDPRRRAGQEALARALDERSEAVRSGPDELEPLAAWVRGEGADSRAGLLAQELLGRLFVPGFAATEESWADAEALVAAPHTWKAFWWLATGRLGRVQRRLARAVGGDLSAVNAIGIAVHNVVRGLRHMRLLYADAGARASLPPGEAARRCIAAPAALYRQADAPGRLGECPFPKGALFVLEIGKASRREGGLPLAFMDETWSRCPAARWVPAMLEGLWRRAVRPAAEG